MVEATNTEAAAQRFESSLRLILTAVYGTALHLTHDLDNAEDLVQEVALQAFRTVDSFQQGTNFKTWFFRIPTNLFINAYRKRQRTPEVETLSESDDAPALYLFKRTRELGMHARSPGARRVCDRATGGGTGQPSHSHATRGLPCRLRSLFYGGVFISGDRRDCWVSGRDGAVRLHRGRRMLQKALWHIAEQQGLIADFHASEG
jgi:RNA polymerase sigma-70 factor (ECF subfamily)